MGVRFIVQGEEETTYPLTCKLRGDQLNFVRMQSYAASSLSKNTPSGMVWADGPLAHAEASCLARSK